ncbi:hypothetical protein AVEN_181690-1 [Araneus ventricosus]|uniref:Uncharacterized protein n=1 Tax=Araneus ventricosus TaxID=182803 RepID=A0A4Y2MMI6_ARAVE|nr:hypothetical protein AVEN_181690-1 [Araneus ventricosus]
MICSGQRLALAIWQRFKSVYQLLDFNRDPLEMKQAVLDEPENIQINGQNSLSQRMENRVNSLNSDNTAIFQIGSDMSAVQDHQGKFAGKFSDSPLKNSKPAICLRDYGISVLYHNSHHRPRLDPSLRRYVPSSEWGNSTHTISGAD